MLRKIKMSKIVITHFYEQMSGNVVVSYSAGKDSTVLLHLVRSLYPDVKALFYNTSNEYAEIVYTARDTPNTVILEPKENFKWTILNKGYPFVSKKFSFAHSRLFTAAHDHFIRTGVSVWMKDGHTKVIDSLPYMWMFLIDIKMIETLEKHYKDILGPESCKLMEKKIQHWYEVSRRQRQAFGIKDDTKIKLSSDCCDYLKKKPAAEYQKQHGCGIYIGTKSHDSRLRQIRFNSLGAIDHENKRCYPLMLWTDEDIHNYIKANNLKLPSVYEKYNLTSTGCVMCGFGIKKDLQRFDKISEQIPRRWSQFKDLKNKDSDLTFGEVVDLIVSTLKSKP